MGSTAPPWRRVFDAVEGRITPPVEKAVATDAFGDAVALAVRLQRRLQREAERQTRRVLHLANLPTATDVRQVAEQLARLERQTRALEHELERRRAGAGNGDAAGRPRRAAAPGRGKG